MATDFVVLKLIFDYKSTMYETKSLSRNSTEPGLITNLFLMSRYKISIFIPEKFNLDEKRFGALAVRYNSLFSCDHISSVSILWPKCHAGSFIAFKDSWQKWVAIIPKALKRGWKYTGRCDMSRNDHITSVVQWYKGPLLVRFFQSLKYAYACISLSEKIGPYKII